MQLDAEMVDCARRTKKIHIYSYSEVEPSAVVGNFHVKIRRKARFVKEDVCTGCDCTEVSAQEGPERLILGATTAARSISRLRKAVPKVATIDPNYCNMLKNGKCGVCAKVCSAGAIDWQADRHLHRVVNTAPSSPRRASTPPTFQIR